MLYIIATEALLCNIRNNENIRGFIAPKNIEIKVKEYADDTAVNIKDTESVENTIRAVERFGLATESKINLEDKYSTM